MLPSLRARGSEYRYTYDPDPATQSEISKKADAFGYSTDEIAREPDFAPLRQEPAFQQLVTGPGKPAM